jgi:ABC-type phosphate/phosphonate transport system substrate-binding protein
MDVRLRVLMESPPVPHTLVVVHSRVPEVERAAVRKTLLETTLSDVSPDLRKVFIVGGKRAFISVDDAYMDPVRSFLKAIRKLP